MSLCSIPSTNNSYSEVTMSRGMKDVIMLHPGFLIPLYGLYFSLNKSMFIDYFVCIYFPELELTDTTTMARSTS